ncbi:MAG: transcription-repair coupling factor [Candidatus Omnitrophica bacterium]|nr:transcription-repair coupling factor [Candidatus Omnitrophota bacterium]
MLTDRYKITVGLEIERSYLIEKLADMHYQRAELVSKPGEYAIRGNLIDVYPVTYRSPVRLEFLADTIAHIRDFSLQTGETRTNLEEVFLIPVTSLFERKMSRFEERYQTQEPVIDVRDLKRGDHIVHMKYGIGKYLGTKPIQIKGQRRNYLAIEYAAKEILYLDPREPMERYIGGDGKPPKVTKLHGKDWDRIKDKTKRAVETIAHDMIEIQARRRLEKGFIFPKDHAWQKDFEDEFPYEATPDQIQAISDVKRDMESDRPMDRLLAGDVGYGKTEVAMRAAFKAVTTGGKQVAVLVPTTVLAEQHYLVFKERMKKFPVTVEGLSRFRSRAEQLKIVQAVKEGKIDIVIGTHRLLSRDIHFKDLGMVVIDEEQRFGVSHKERLKHLRTQIDVLTMTATPIPRTLYMSLVGVRDMSAIQTPPSTRLPIETFITEYDDDKVKRAILDELAREGQIYFIHNRVQSIEKIHHHLRDILPQVRFGVAHGQMGPRELESVMKAFLEKRMDCLIATSIIESGIDIPNVNTILVNRADQFGLADLYQLRGRVGRYQEKRQAYAYFMVPKHSALSSTAEKRLSAIERFTELGSGFKIAMEDLEIRGAGNLLGHEQSGFIHAVGFDLYCRMLRKAIEDQEKKK